MHDGAIVGAPAFTAAECLLYLRSQLAAYSQLTHMAIVYAQV
jgi:hypothetical protein